MNQSQQIHHDINEIKRTIDNQLKTTNVFIYSSYEAESYIDNLLNDQCDYALHKGIETFDVNEFIQILSTIKSRTESQFVTYLKSVNKLQGECIKEEEEHQQTMVTVKKKYNKCVEEFKQIENDVTEISTDVMQAGERLQDLRAEVKRGKQAMQILELFKQLNVDKQFDPRKYDKDRPKKNFAIVLKKLKTLSKELHNPDTALGKRNIEKLYEYIEIVYLQKFIDYLKEKNIRGMTEISMFLFY